MSVKKLICDNMSLLNAKNMSGKLLVFQDKTLRFSFNLFWNRSSVFRTDEVHPTWLGSQMLVANMQHALQAAPWGLIV